MLRASNAPRDRPPVAGPKSILRNIAYGRTPAAAHDEPSHSEVYRVNERGTNPSTQAHSKLADQSSKSVCTARQAKRAPQRNPRPACAQAILPFTIGSKAVIASCDAALPRP
jgi:hypothetical protein